MRRTGQLLLPQVPLLLVLKPQVQALAQAVVRVLAQVAALVQVREPEPMQAQQLAQVREPPRVQELAQQPELAAAPKQVWELRVSRQLEL